MKLAENLNQIFSQNKTYTLNQLVAILGLEKKDKDLIKHTLKGMDVVLDNGRYGSYAASGLISGTLQGTKGDFCFVIPDDGSEDIFVPLQDSLGALDGDFVMVKPISQEKSPAKQAKGKYSHNYETPAHKNTNQKSGAHRKGRVVKITAHNTVNIVGQCVFSGSQAFVLSSNSRIKRPVLLSSRNKELRPFILVSCRITSYPEHGPLVGELCQVLGFGWEPGVDMLTVIKQYDLPDTFDQALLDQANSIAAAGINKAGRRDLTDKYIFTMDGADAKDLDDAVSVEKLEDGYILGVHIADVSHYVRPDSALDAEAAKRGTSVYLPGSVLPMLPPALSNGICSLSEGEERLTLSVEMRISNTGEILEKSIFPSVIRSRKRLTYEEASLYFDSKQNMPHPLGDILNNAKQLALILQKRRSQKGALDFELDEPEFILDQNKRVISVTARKRLISHRIIEQFMLTANVAVADFMLQNGLPAVFRVHENPDKLKMEQLSQTIAPFGFNIGENPSPLDCSRLLDAANGTPQQRLISTLLLRSMKKACYSNENLGHFGLAEDSYLHFTSPIRRYPDLLVHRMIHFYLDKNTSALAKYNKRLAELANKCSKRELTATEAERDADDIKKAEFAQGLIGQSFHGIISGISASALWVWLPNTLECVVPFHTLDDFYTFDPSKMAAIGKRTRKILAMGDDAQITITDANPAQRRIEAEFTRTSGKSTGGKSTKGNRNIKSDKSQKNGNNAKKLSGKAHGNKRKTKKR